MLIGLAVILAPVVADKPVAGDHVNVAPPPAVKAVELPLHIATFPLVVVGVPLIVTVVVV